MRQAAGQARLEKISPPGKMCRQVGEMRKNEREADALAHERICFYPNAFIPEMKERIGLHGDSSFIVCSFVGMG